MTAKKRNSIKYGDPRIFFETTTTAPFNGPAGITHETGAVVRGSAYIDVDDRKVSISLPSMAELMYHQASKSLQKAAQLKSRALKVGSANSYHLLEDEEAFYTYIQLCSLGILGLYSSIESMVYELYIRKNKERKVLIDGRELTFAQFTNLGFDRKITSVAAQLSAKPNIFGTDLFVKTKELKRLRTIIQHWDVERRDDYFINLPENHPLKVFPEIDPNKLAEDTRSILDHYRMG